MQCLGMPSRFPGMNDIKHSPSFLRQVLDACVPGVPWRSTWKLMCCFFIVTNARQILTLVFKVLDVPFEWGICIDMYYQRNFLFDPPTLLKSSWYFPKRDFQAENLFTGVTGDTGVNMCLHHARNRIAVQNNALISMLVPSNIVAYFRVGLVRKKIPEFSWLHYGRRHLVNHVTVRDRTMACHFFLRPTMFSNDGSSASMRSLWVQSL